MPIPKLAITAGLMLAQIAMGAAQEFEGPRLDDLSVSTADYGTPITRFWGTRKLEGCPIFHAEKLREKKTTSKTKGGKYDEYKYFATFAVLIADHEIAGVKRIWLDNHLAYDAAATGPFSIGSLAGLKLHRQRNMRVYLGTEDQEPDPRYVSWCEDRYGADSAPAFKGSAYVFFEELPVEKFGNRVPQVTIEAVSAKTDIYPVEVKSAALHLQWVKFNQNFSRFLVDNGTTAEIWDTPTRTKLFSVDVHGAYGAFDAAGAIWTTGDLLGSTLFRNGADGQGPFASYALPDDVFSDYVFCFGAGVYLAPYSGVQNYFIYLIGDTVEAVDVGFAPSSYFEDEEGDVWAVGASSGFLHFHSLTAGSFSVATPSGSTAGHALDNGLGGFFCRHGNHLVLIDKATRTVTATAAVAGNQARTLDAFRNAPMGVESLWFQHGITTASEYSTATLALRRTVNLSAWRATDVDDLVYDPVNHALITAPQITNEMDWRYLDRFTSTGTTLAAIVADVAEWCGVTSVDASDLDQAVAGYSVVQGTGRGMVEPLLTLHDSDARCHDFSLQFIKRGDAAAGTAIDTAQFAADGQARFAQTIAGDGDLPRRLSVSFADSGKDQKKNTVVAQRHRDAVDTDREPSIDLTTYVASAGDMQKLADRYLRRVWNDIEDSRFALTAQQLALECGDVKTVELDGLERTVRIERMTISAGVLRVEGKRDHPSLATLSTGTGAEMDGRDDEVIFIPAPSKGIVLDIPLVRDVDNSLNPKLYYAAGPYTGAGFIGAIIQIGDDGEEYEDWNAVDSASPASWGYSTDALANVGTPWLWDRASSVNIKLFNGSLSSVTEADIDANPMLNLAAIGGELFNFATATLEADGTYTLSRLKRGRRGTEGLTAAHAAADLFVLVSSLADDQLGLSQAGTDLFFRTETAGRDPAGGQVIEMAFVGNTLKPYAPARLKAVFDGTDLDCTIIRRTRVGGAWTGGTTIPLAENSEEYEVDVYNGATFKRTITVTGTNAFTYTAAMASADGIALPARPAFKVYQMSDAVGRGFELVA